ncbi:MAG: helix-turn-helix transcriptional regulator [Polyangiaceae bacterium]
MIEEELVVELLAAAYSTDATYEAWRSHLMSLLVRLNPGAETCTWFEYDWHFVADGGLVFDAIHSAHVTGAHAAVDTWLDARQKISPKLLARLFGRTGAGTAMTYVSPVHDLEKLNTAWRELWLGPVVDSVGIVAADPAGRGMCASIGLPQRRMLSPRHLGLLERVAVHMSAGRRLRLGDRARLVDEAEAIMTPDGKILHARNTAKNKHESLQDGRRRRAHATKLRRDPEKALEIWKGLVAGRWSLVDHFDTDGKRFLLAIKNTSKVEPRADLSPRERRVCALVAMGHRDKEIAYMLGLTLGSVTAALHRARMKMKVGSRTELAAVWKKR